MSERLLELLDGISNRRGFLGKMASAAVGLMASLFGFTKLVYSQANGTCTGCSLCLPSTPNCMGVCCWSWLCCTSDNMLHSCKECYDTNDFCDGRCSDPNENPIVKCSEDVITGQNCPEPPDSPRKPFL